MGESGGGGEWWWGRVVAGVRVVAWVSGGGRERRKRIQRAGDEERQKMGEGKKRHVNTDIYIIAGQR